MKPSFKFKIFEVFALFLAFINLFFCLTVNASNLNKNTEKLNISLETSNQNPKTKEFDLIITIKSDLDSDRVILETNLSKYLEFVNEDDKRISLNLKAGVETIQKIKIRPISSVSGKITVVLTLVKADVYYTATESIDITLNKNKELLPITSEYKKAKYLNYLKNFIIISSSISFVSFLVYKFYKRYSNLKNS